MAKQVKDKFSELEDAPLFVRMTSLGCAKNFVESELAAASFVQAGFGLASCDEEADVYFINTCAFLLSARKEAEKNVAFAVRWKNSDRANRIIVVAGCIAAWDKDGLFRNAFPEVDLWLGIDSVHEAGKIVRDFIRGKKHRICSSCDFIMTDSTPRLLLTPPHYAYLKIADGCDNFCTYCMIPSIRGKLRTPPMKAVLKQAEDLLSSGVKELIVIAQDLTALGRDRGEKDGLAKLIKELDKLGGDFIFRLMYLHPAWVTKKILDAAGEAKHVVPCLEMPIQHVSDHVLKAMNRHVTEKGLRELVRTIRQDLKFDLRTTVMTGFPGETEEDFIKLCDFVTETRFARLGAFAFSPEEGTAAAKMPDQISGKTAVSRRNKIMKIQSKIALENNEALVGKTTDVIADSSERRIVTGRTFCDAPDIDDVVTMRVPPGREMPSCGDVVKMKVTEASEYELKGILA